MSLTIAHINKEEPDDEAEAFGREVLRPKWEARMTRDAVKLFAKHGIKITPYEISNGNGELDESGAIIDQDKKVRP